MAEALMILVGLIAGPGVNILLGAKPAQDPGAICVIFAIMLAFLMN